MFSRILYVLFGRSRMTESKNFFDYPAREKKRIIVAAAKAAARQQEATLKQYQSMFPSGR